MKTIPVTSLRGAYAIHTGSGLLEKTGALLRQAGLSGKTMVVSQPAIAKRYLGRVAKSLERGGFKVGTHLLPVGEKAKSGAELFKLYRTLVRFGFERRDTVVALGGGVVGDVSGFAAATFLRGVPFVNIATTLLAQVDSAIGGKTAVNLSEGKNLVGAFYPPKLVVSDIGVLASLPDRELRASLAEAVKCGVIRDASLFRLFETSAKKILARDRALLERIIGASAGIKAGVVSRDEFETRGERMILNFGHTFGHGIEQALGYKRLLHGEAVSIGMVMASRLACELGMLEEALHARLAAVLIALNLPVSTDGLGLAPDRIWAAMGRDKKKKAGVLRFVLPEEIGKVAVRSDVPEKLVRKILIQGGHCHG